MVRVEGGKYVRSRINIDFACGFDVVRNGQLGWMRIVEVMSIREDVTRLSVVHTRIVVELLI